MSEQAADLSIFVQALHYAAHQHRNQRRKGPQAEPYVNHLIHVANLLSQAGVSDVEVLAAALLHDVVEDTDATVQDVEARFGARVARFVEACTDDKSLPKLERKRQQVQRVHAAVLEVKLIKLADHCSNVTSLPSDWPEQRKREYLAWSEQVVAGCTGVNAQLEALHAELVARSREQLA